MKPACGCCEGIERITPVSVANRPGLPALTYRVGTHATFLETMLARLSTLYIDVPIDGRDDQTERIYPLTTLGTRSTDDPAIALLDAWAIVAHILSFYQERIANEGYLRTATERLSILELAHLVGYKLRPGLAASVYLGFTLQAGHTVDIPAGTRSQSTPGPNETVQFFETMDTLPSRDKWNNLQPRLTRPQMITCGDDPESGAESIETLYFKGISTNLKPNDALLLVCGDGPKQQVLRRVHSISPQADDNRTEVTLQALQPTPLPKIGDELKARLQNLESEFPHNRIRDQVEQIIDQLQTDLSKDPKRFHESLFARLPELQKQQSLALKRKYTRLEAWISEFVSDLQKLSEVLSASEKAGTVVGTPGSKQTARASSIAILGGLLDKLNLAAASHPASSAQLPRSVQQTYGAEADIAPRLLAAFRPAVEQTLYRAWEGVATPDAPVSVYALRAKVGLFGHNAPPEVSIDDNQITRGEWPIVETTEDAAGNPSTVSALDEDPNTVYLDGAFDKVLPNSWLVVDSTAVAAGSPGLVNTEPMVARAGSPNAGISRTGYGVSGITTRILLKDPRSLAARQWIKLPAVKDKATGTYPDLSFLRSTLVYAQSEELELAEEPIDDDVAGNEIELDGLYDGLDAGRWLIVTGERTDIENVTGVTASELVMLAGVRQSSTAPADSVHTTLTLSDPLSYSYDVNTVKIYGNVALATHGETRSEILGSGDGSQTLQQFILKQSPLTYIPAATPEGAQSTLQVRVNDLLWHEVDTLADRQPRDRDYVSDADDDDKTSITFGNGVKGARLPTGVANVTAVYRRGIGEPGNVNAKQIDTLTTKPLGVTEVLNPLPAGGGANRDSRDQARRNAPLAVMALDRLVSVQDYADFSRTYAGIGKASAVRLSDGRRQLVHTTIAGANDIPVDTNSDLYRNLLQTLHQLGDPNQAVQLGIRTLNFLLIVARVKVLPDYLWAVIEPQVRAALLEAFGFDNRDLGQRAQLSEVFSAIQSVEGVAYVDIQHLDSVPENVTTTQLAKLSTLGLKATIDAQLAQANSALSFDAPNRILPAQLVILSPKVPDTLILTEITV
jgi:predicted phage baseplate assembly protein